MHLTLVGHASWLVRSGRTTLLTDPTLLPTFTDATWEVCPSRRLSLRRLPRLDAVFVSHAHRDHFDIASLARLPRGTRVFCPSDADILYALKHLGFEDVVEVSPGATSSWGTSSSSSPRRTCASPRWDCS